MKTLRLTLLLFAVSANGLALAQWKPSPYDPAGTQNQMQNGSSAENTAAQRHYDPVAGRGRLRGGIWDSALNRINPENRDFGACVSVWRKVTVSETIDNAVFWTAIAIAAGLLFALLFIYWVLLDRARRLAISVNILTQIANAYIDARDHALDAIEKHNRLADDYNAMAERMATFEQQRAENQRRVRGESKAAAAPDESIDDSPLDSSGAKQLAHAELDPQLLAQLQQEAEAQARQKLAHQISALNEKNKTLRVSMNEVLNENERLKREHAALKGAY